MKIAVCFSGQVRTAVHAAPNLLRFFGDLLPSIDFFIHTWDINRYKQYGSLSGNQLPPPWRPNVIISEPAPPSPVPEEDMNRYREIYNPKVMIIEPYSNYLNYYTPDQLRRDPVLHYTWRKSLFYCLEYSLHCNIKYDIVIKLRPDVIFPPKRRLIQEVENFLLDTDAFYCDNGTETSTDDIFWLSSMKNMLALSDFGDPHLCVDKNLLFVDYILSIGVKLKPMIKYGYAPLRVEALRFDVLNEFEKIFYEDHYWFSGNPPAEWIDYE